MTTANQIRKWLIEEGLKRPILRLASCLSCVEICLALKEVMQPKDTLIISKAHGAATWYRINGAESMDNLPLIAEHGTMGLTASCGALGNGLGMGIGIALAKPNAHVWVMAGDGEMNEGNMLEAMAYLRELELEHQIKNITLIIDNNGRSMRRITNVVAPYGYESVDGHNLEATKEALRWKATVLACKTIKGKGVKVLEENSLCHIMQLKPEQAQEAIAAL